MERSADAPGGRPQHVDARGRAHVGVPEHDDLRTTLQVLASLGSVSTCLIVMGAPDEPHLFGFVEGVPPSSESILASLSPTGTSPTPVSGGGWVAPIRDGTSTVGASLVHCTDETTGKQLAVALASATGVAAKPDLGELDRVAALHSLVDIAKQLHSPGTPVEVVLDSIVERAHELIGADVTWLAVADVGRKESRVVAARGARTPILPTLVVRLGEGLNLLTSAAGEVITLRDENHTDPRLSVHQRGVLRDEGIESLACAPLSHREEPVGTLLVGFRRNASMPHDVQYLLGALSSQAALAISNARLNNSLQEQNDLLQRHFTLSTSLTRISLAGGGTHGLGTELARLLGKDVVIERTDERASVWRYATTGSEPMQLPNGQADSDTSGQAAVIRVGGKRVGQVRLADSRLTTTSEHAALEVGATAISLELTKEMAALEAEWRVSGELIEELLRERDAVTESLRQRAQQAGINVDTPSTIAVVETLVHSDLIHLARMLRSGSTARGVLVAIRSDQVVILLQEAEAANKRMKRWLQRAKDLQHSVIAGLSEPRVDLALALNEAQAAVRLAREGRQPGVLIEAAALGPLRILLDVADPQQMVQLVSTTLGPVAEHDRERQRDLLLTLRTFLDVGGNHPATAERCNVHLNTVKYRLARTAEILGRNLSEPAVRFELSLAFAVSDVLDVLGISPWTNGSDGR